MEFDRDPYLREIHQARMALKGILAQNFGAPAANAVMAGLERYVDAKVEFAVRCAEEEQI
jgi:hypothetical protein